MPSGACSNHCFGADNGRLHDTSALLDHAQIYLAVNALLANGGQVKSAAVQAEQAVDSISSEATKVGILAKAYLYHHFGGVW